VNEFALFLSIQSIVQLRLIADSIGGGAILGAISSSEEPDKSESITSVLYLYSCLALIVGISSYIASRSLLINSPNLEDAAYLVPWCISVGLAFVIFFSGRTTTVEGYEKVVEAALLKLCLSGGYVLLVAVGLIVGLGVKSIPAGLSGSVLAWIACATYLGIPTLPKRKRLLCTPVANGQRNKFKATKKRLLQFWPLQWRMILSWTGGYGMVYLPAPVLLLLGEPALSASAGMSLQVLQALAGLSLIPAAVRIPLLARSSLPWGVKVKIFSKARAVSILFYIFGICLTTAILSTDVILSSAIGKKIPSTSSFVIYAVSFSGYLILYLESIKYRARAREPFWAFYLLYAFGSVSTLAYFGTLINHIQSATAFAGFTAFATILLVAYSARLERNEYS